MAGFFIPAYLLLHFHDRVSDPSPLVVCRLSSLALGRFVEDEKAHCKEGWRMWRRSGSCHPPPASWIMRPARAPLAALEMARTVFSPR